MNKPTGYDATQTGSEYTPIALGGHTAVIKRVEESTSSTGKPMIKVAIDFDMNDRQPEYFMNAFKADDRPDKRWPYQAVQYIVTEDADGKCAKSFKSFITAVEQSNKAKVVWGADFATWFTNKKVGVIYGVVEDEYNGEVKRRHRIRFFCQYDGALERQAPQPRLLDSTPQQDTFVPVSANDAPPIPF